MLMRTILCGLIQLFIIGIALSVGFKSVPAQQIVDKEQLYLPLIDNSSKATSTLTAMHTPIVEGTPTPIVTSPTATEIVPSTATSMPTDRPISGELSIHTVSDNLADYPNERVPKYAKLELKFGVDTSARNVQWPYDLAPPPGITPEEGISVDAFFTPDNWRTVYQQPGFYYQEYIHDIKSGKDWIYPTGTFDWRVRFTPNQNGTWQYKIKARDANGVVETEPTTFEVVESKDKGFVRVSQRDPRYFEYENGDLFVGLGYNLTFNHLGWNNPYTINKPRVEKFQEYGLQFFRTWLSDWGIFTSAWNAWDSPLPERHGGYIPYSSLSTEYTYPNSEVSMKLNRNWNPAMFLGFTKQPPAVKQNTKYRVSVRYLIPKLLNGPRVAEHPYGLVLKTGGWLTGAGVFPENVKGFADPGTGNLISVHVNQSPNDPSGIPIWSTLEGEINTGNNDFLPFVYLVLENIPSEPTDGNDDAVYIDRVEIREDIGNGQFGPNIVSKPWMAHHLYFEQRNSFAFDKALELAEQNDIYLKLVILEKNEWILNRIDDNGAMIPDDSKCRDSDSANDPEKCPGNRWFYGNGRQVSKVRWLQQAWGRYLQARWGYSTSIHSWELLNEGDPVNEHHYALADEFGRYMHQFTPNDHLVTTSFWHSFPGGRFWANDSYTNIDYADIHAYATESTDTAGNSFMLSKKHGALETRGANKPLVRGETGFSDDVLADTAGVWLHNYIWANINSGGMYEQYWYALKHIEQEKQGNDLRYHYLPYKNFIKDIPLNNGLYVDINAMASSPGMRVMGQKDLEHNCAHMWLQNQQHTWKNIVDNISIPSVSGTLVIFGLQPGVYFIEEWNTHETDSTKQIVNHYTSIVATDKIYG